MNIEIINKQISVNLGVPEKDVIAINKFFWQNIRSHIYNYNSRPINISNVCVLYPDAFLNKREIYRHIRAIRKLRFNKRYKENSAMRNSAIEEIKIKLRKCLNIRKENKFTN